MYIQPTIYKCRSFLSIAAFCISISFLGVFLVGCQIAGKSSTDSSSPSPGGKPQRGTKPYTIRGQTYHPLKNAHGFSENGIASWYGKDFHGKLTANGERYNMYGMTAAHKLLPFGTQVRVINKKNGKSIIVRINDRGPFVANRVIDLTKTGAEKIDMLGPGTASVRLETIGGVPAMKDNGDMAGRFFVQVGAFASKSNAEGLVATMKKQGTSARMSYYDNQNLWRVQAGPYPSLFSAQKASSPLKGFVVAD